MTCPFIAFVSVRGGTGRTMGAASCALRAHNQGLRPLLIDLDLEAPGLTHEIAKILGPTRGLCDLALDEVYDRERGALIAEVLRHARVLPGLGIAALAAAKIDEDSTIWSASDWLYEQEAGERWMLRLKLEIATSGAFDCVLLDLRAGFAKITNRVLADIADCLVVLSHPPESHQKDTDRFLRHAADLRRQSRMAPLHVIRATTMIPQNVHVPADQVLVGYHPQLPYTDALSTDKLERSLVDFQYGSLSETVVNWIKLSASGRTARGPYSGVPG